LYAEGRLSAACPEKNTAGFFLQSVEIAGKVCYNKSASGQTDFLTGDETEI
jgi:hypothetical protein